MDENTAGDSFGAAMRRLRTERGMSLSQLAAATQYSKSHLSNIENDRKRPHRGLAQRLDEVLGAGGELCRRCDAAASQAGQRVLPCPFRGLAAFEEWDARWFFGRDKATATLVDQVLRAEQDGVPVIVVGASGAGKSSLLRAGLLPRVAAGELGQRDDDRGPWRSLVVTPGADPAESLARSLATEVPHTPKELADAIRSGRLPPGCETEMGRLLLVVDQLEEVFTLCQDPSERSAFLDVLCAVPRAVLAVRADFTASCLTHPGLVRALQNHTVALGAMSRSDLVETIRRPVQLAGLELEDGLVDVLLHDLDPGARGYEPGALPLLSHALLATWQQRAGKQLTLAGYQRTGGIHGAVATTAERVYRDLPPDDRSAARRMMLRLVRVGEEGSDTRRRTERRLLGADEERTLEVFTRARLLTIDGTKVEIAHEALLRAWPRLAGWLDADRDSIRTHQHVAEAADTWDRARRPASLLLQGAALAVAVQWAAEHPGRAAASEREFLAASTHEAQRGVRRMRRALAALALLAVLLLLAGSAFAVQWHKASVQTRQANARALAERASALRGSDPAQAAELSLAAYRTDPHEAAARQAVLSTSGLPHATPLGGNGEAVSAFATGGAAAHRLLATGSREGEVRVWRLTGGGPVPYTRLSLHGAPIVYGLGFTRDQRGLVVAGTDGIRVWNLHGTRTPTPGALLESTDDVLDARFSRDGRTFAAACDDGVLRLWDLTDPLHPGPVRPLRAGREHLVSVSFSRDASRIATADSQGGVVIWARTARGDYHTADTESFSGPVVEAALAPDGDRIAMAAADGTMTMCALNQRGACTHRHMAEPATTEYAAGLAYSPDGTLLAEADRAGRLNLRDPRDGAVLLSLPHPRRLQSLAWAGDGRTLITGAADGGVAHLWQLPLPALIGHTGTLTGIALHRGRSLAATSSLDKTVRLWSVGDPRHPVPLATLRHRAGVTAVALSPDGSRLAAGTVDGTVHLWDIAGGPRELDTANGPLTDRITALAFAPDGRRIAASSYDDRTALWHLDAPKNHLTVHTLFSDPDSDGVYSVAFALHGRVLVTGESDRKVRIWDTRSRGTVRKPLRKLSGSDSIVSAVAASGQLLAAGGQDDSIRLWRLDPDQLRRQPTLLAQAPTAHTGHITALAFASDARTLLSAGEDGLVVIWDLAQPDRPTVRDSLRSPGESVTAAALAPDASQIWTTANRTARHWTTDPEATASRLCAATSPGPTTRSSTGRLPESSGVPPCG